jgi:hypothetical protein
MRIMGFLLVVGLGALLLSAAPVAGQQPERVVLLSRFPDLEGLDTSAADLVRWVEENLETEMRTAFNKLDSPFLTAQTERYEFVPFDFIRVGRLDIRAKELPVRDALIYNASLKRFLEDNHIDYFIVMELEILPFGNLWEFSWVFANIKKADFQLLAGDHHTSADNIMGLYEFCRQTPMKVAEGFKQTFAEPSTATPAAGEPPPEIPANRMKIIVTSCFWHSVADETRKEILDRLQAQLPTALAGDLQKSGPLNDAFEVIPYAYPKRCVSVSDDLDREIITNLKADYIIKANMDMEQSMNRIHFFLMFISKEGNRPEAFEVKYRRKSNFAPQVVSKHLAEEICSRWSALKQ